MITINEWTIIELSNFVINGKVDFKNFYTDRLLLVKNGYAVTDKEIYKLGEPDRVWIETPQAKERLRMFE